MASARFEIVLSQTNDTQLVIRDVGHTKGHPTITNDAEAVVTYLFQTRAMKGNRRLYYYDSDNNLDEIVVVDGKFAGFRPGGPVEQAAAIEVVQRADSQVWERTPGDSDADRMSGHAAAKRLYNLGALGPTLVSAIEFVAACDIGAVIKTGVSAYERVA